MNGNGSRSLMPRPSRTRWHHDDFSVNQLGSVALGGIEGEKVLQRELRLASGSRVMTIMFRSFLAAATLPRKLNGTPPFHY